MTRPSETVRRQIYVNFWFEAAGIKLRHEIGIDNIMWESDFPHVASYYPSRGRRSSACWKACRRRTAASCSTRTPSGSTASTRTVPDKKRISGGRAAVQLKYGFISVDDHVQEPPDLWTRRISKAAGASGSLISSAHRRVGALGRRRQGSARRSRG